jgi:hypothetical protein
VPSTGSTPTTAKSPSKRMKERTPLLSKYIATAIVVLLYLYVLLGLWYLGS